MQTGVRADLFDLLVNEIRPSSNQVVVVTASSRVKGRTVLKGKFVTTGRIFCWMGGFRF